MQSIKKELPKTVFQVGISALGFLIALGINHLLANRNEHQAYDAMLKSVTSEAASNKTILEDSFLKYFDVGVVIREFSLTAATQCLANPTFVKNAKPEELELLNQYLRNLSLANGYRKTSETLLLAQSKDNDAWLNSVRDEWGKDLQLCQEDIDKTLKLH